MTPTILVVGATGNTGRSVVQTLSNLLSADSTAPAYTVLALTRSSQGAAAKQLAELPHVQVVEQNWVEITADWLRQHGVTKAFIASHNEPTQFSDESTFHVAALNAGVKYVVRISTTAANVRPDCLAYYPRTHWAIEALLDSPQFQAMHWTSLQPNIFTSFLLGSAAAFVKEFRATGKQHPLRLMASEDAPIGAIDADDVGTFAAHLLFSQDSAAHNKARYVLNGPEDITGRQIVKMVEKRIGTQVQDVHYKDMSFVEQMAAHAPKQIQHHLLSVKHAPTTAWEGQCTASTTSKAVFEIAAPKTTPTQALDKILEETQSGTSLLKLP